MRMWKPTECSSLLRPRTEPTESCSTYCWWLRRRPGPRRRSPGGSPCLASYRPSASGSGQRILRDSRAVRRSRASRGSSLAPQAGPRCTAQTRASRACTCRLKRVAIGVRSSARREKDVQAVVRTVPLSSVLVKRALVDGVVGGVEGALPVDPWLAPDLHTF